MYAGRGKIQDLSGRLLESSYFIQRLLPDYLAEKKPAWAANVVFDDRGHFTEPHTERMIGLGTVAVRNYLIFSNVATFERNGRRYTYRHKFDVQHLGLRLEDVRALDIEHLAEAVTDTGKREIRRANLLRNGATEEEAEFLLKKRVELNALTADQLVEFIETKLKLHGVKKIVPDRDTLARAYRLFERGVRIRKLMEAEIAKADPNAPVPENLEARVNEYLKQHPEVSWNYAAAVIAGYEQEDE
jgi:hypothetical protein